VRAGLSGRPLEVDELLKSIRIPVLVTHGALDRNSNLIAAEYTAKMIPGAKLSVYQGSATRPSSRTPRASTPSSPPSCVMRRR